MFDVTMNVRQTEGATVVHERETFRDPVPACAKWSRGDHACELCLGSRDAHTRRFHQNGILS